MKLTYSETLAAAPAHTTAQARPRLAYLDALRVFLTLLVIAHHAAIAYGGAGDWPVKDPAVDDFSPILLTIFNAVNQSFFMAAFFLLAGYFTPPALAAKGAWRFLAERLIRLGVPLAIYSTLIVNLNQFVLASFYRGEPYRPFLAYSPGHLWFVQALLLFALAYVLVTSVARQLNGGSRQPVVDGRRSPARLPTSDPVTRPFPGTPTLLGCVGLLALLTFGVRQYYPVGVWALGVQPAHFVHYMFAFTTGTLAYRYGWLEALPARRARRWGLGALAGIPLFVLLAVLAGAIENPANAGRLLGGWHWAALAFALWESWLLIGITMGLLALFRARYQRGGALGRALAANAYAAYIVHQSVLITLQIALLAAPIPTIIKFFVATALAATASFGLAALIRRLPGARHVLG